MKQQFDYEYLEKMEEVRNHIQECEGRYLGCVKIIIQISWRKNV